MNSKRSYLESLNAGRQRQPHRSIEELNRTLETLEGRLDASRRPAEHAAHQGDDIARRMQRLAGQASWPQAEPAAATRKALASAFGISGGGFTATSVTAGSDILVTSVMPHMHWLGKDFTFTAADITKMVGRRLTEIIPTNNFAGNRFDSSLPDDIETVRAIRPGSG